MNRPTDVHGLPHPPLALVGHGTAESPEPGPPDATDPRRTGPSRAPAGPPARTSPPDGRRPRRPCCTPNSGSGRPTSSG